jgi:hypothetical protein
MTVGINGHRNDGMMEEWKNGKGHQNQGTENWKGGRMEENKTGMMEGWNAGRMGEHEVGRANAERVERHGIGRMEYWKIGPLFHSCFSVFHHSILPLLAFAFAQAPEDYAE